MMTLRWEPLKRDLHKHEPSREYKTNLCGAGCVSVWVQWVRRGASLSWQGDDMKSLFIRLFFLPSFELYARIIKVARREKT